MELTINNEGTVYWKKLLEMTVLQEETAELSIPEHMPDVLRIIRTEAVPVMKEKITDTGRVSVSGIVSVRVLYCAEGTDELYPLDREVPFTCAVTNTEVDADSAAVAVTDLFGVDGASSGTRHIVVRLSLRTNVSCYKREKMVAGTHWRESEACVETKTESIEALMPVSVMEKTAVLSDEFDLAGSSDAVPEILSYTVCPLQRDYKIVGSKLVFRGAVKYSVLLKIGKTVEQREFEKEFSQMLEPEDLNQTDLFEFHLMPSAVYLQCTASAEGTVFRLVSELQLVSQCIQKRTETIEYLSDAYAVGTDCFYPERESFVLTISEQTQQQSELITQTVETPEKVSQIICTRVLCAPTVKQEHGVQSTVCVLMLFLDEEGRYWAVRRRIEVSSATLPEQADDAVSRAEVTEIFAVPSSGGIDLRMTVLFRFFRAQTEQILPVTGGQLTAKAPEEVDTRSLVICHVLQGQTLWQIGKRYGASVEDISAVNHLNMQEPEPGSMILIPLKH